MGPGRRGAALVMTAPRPAPDLTPIVSMRNPGHLRNQPVHRRKGFPVRTVLLIGVCGTVTAAIASLAAPAPSHGSVAAVSARRNGRIVFQETVVRFPQIFTIEPDGTARA
jgi:hypothetical protein